MKEAQALQPHGPWFEPLLIAFANEGKGHGRSRKNVPGEFKERAVLSAGA